MQGSAADTSDVPSELLRELEFREPTSGEPLTWQSASQALVADDGRRAAQLTQGVLVFGEERYAGNFGWQWNQFTTTQLDSQTHDTLSEQRLLLSLGLEPEQLRGKRVLEAGCGAGRFTEVLLKHGAQVCAFDASNAVFANARENGSPDAAFMQASIYDLPLAEGQFDIVVCLGVLQHTPDAARVVECLARQVRPGGLLCIDAYPWRFYARLSLRYLVFRPIISRLPATWVRPISRGLVEGWWPFRRVFRSNTVRRAVDLVYPSAVFYYYNVSTNKSDAHLKEWAHLDTHDFLSPRYDRAETLRSLEKKFRQAGLTNVVTEDLRTKKSSEGRTVSGFLVARGTRPL